MVRTITYITTFGPIFSNPFPKGFLKLAVFWKYFLGGTAEWSAVLWKMFEGTACFENFFSSTLGASTDSPKVSGFDWLLRFFLNSRLSTP